MPHLENCSHSQDGWCLKCVGELERGRIECERQFQAKVEEVIRLMNVVDELKLSLANYPAIPDSSPQDCCDLGLHTLPEYLASPYTAKDSE